MKRNKKFIIIMATVATVLALTLSGVVFAEEENGSDDQPLPRHEVLLERVRDIYEENTGVALDSEELQNAFAQAQTLMRDEAMEARLQNLIDQGKITEEEADQLKEWWESRPNAPLLGRFGHLGGPGLGGMRDGVQKQFRHNFAPGFWGGPFPES